MKLLSVLVLSILVVSCGKSETSKKSSTKESRKSMSQVNDALSGLGVMVGLGTLPEEIGKQIIVLCDETKARDTSATSFDRATALQAYHDSIEGSVELEFTDGTRVDVWKVQWAVNSAIGKLEENLSSTKCPAQALGHQKI